MQPHRRQEQSKSFAHYLWGESIYALLGIARLKFLQCFLGSVTHLRISGVQHFDY
jgi:hypothetical protein